MSRTVIYMITLLFASGCAQKLYEYDPEAVAQSSLCPCINITPEQMTKLEKKAVNGHAESALILAKYYGSTVRDENKELFWHKVAGFIGHTAGMLNAGYEYEQRNESEKALAWYMRAIKKDPGTAYARVAELYESHLLPEKHLNLAREYYKKAALHGKTYVIDKVAQYANEGIGGDKDNVEAYAWILVRNHTLFPGSWAANELEKFRKAVRFEMTDEEVQQAEVLYDKYLEVVKKWRNNLLPNCEMDGVSCDAEDEL